MFALAGWTSPDPGGRIEVVGGVRAGTHAYPWMVHLSTGCGGSLIERRFVLTAAHCATIGAGGIVVTAGSGDLDAADTWTTRGSAMIVARGFDDVTHGDDWAVLRLRDELDLPTLRLASDGGGDGGTFTVMGWGTTSEGSMREQRFLREAQVPFVSDAVCGSAYRKAGYDFVPSDMICAGRPDRGGIDTCQGDSGGPMVRRDGDGWVQVGIVSWGLGCARRHYPGVYTQVSHFVSAIRAAVAHLS